MYSKETILLLTDYKGNFGSKWDAEPLRSGFDKELLNENFAKYGYKTVYINFSEIQELDDVSGYNILYTSSEDVGYHYKSYIEDVIYSLQLKGARVIPGYKYLKANNNKVFMELVRSSFNSDLINSLKSWSFGTIEEMNRLEHEFNYPVVIKKSTGAMSKGVYLARNERQLKKIVKGVSETRYLKRDIKDYLRHFLHKEYKKDSLYRNKYIIQEFIPELNHDWKIIVYGDKILILTRHVKKNDFRASGSKENYLAGSRSKKVDGIFDFTERAFKEFDVPNISLDVVHDGSRFHIVEFQAVYYGTSTFNMSDVYYKKVNGEWIKEKIECKIEDLYGESVVRYLDNRITC
ncbi:MAG: hypothetical protein WD431_17220 [Cyclobacteriaceae bacterium]